MWPVLFFLLWLSIWAKLMDIDCLLPFFRSRKYGIARTTVSPVITRSTTKVKLMVGLGSGRLPYLW